MKVSREQMAQNRLRILDLASELFRSRGFESVTVAEIMNAAGLTHGGFYGHFKSKDDLIAQTLDHALRPGADRTFDLYTFLEGYLSTRHRDNPGHGCPTAALVSETRLQSPLARSAMTDGTRVQIERLSKEMPGKNNAEKRCAAIGAWAAMVGAVILSRAMDDHDLSKEVLDQTRAWVSSNPPNQRGR